MSYRGRFAPSPTGPLHAGSLATALASWLDARAHGGAWLVRIEDVDGPRCVPGADRAILRQLADCGLHPDEEPLRQSTRWAAYEQASMRLLACDAAYPCACTRADIEQALSARGESPPRHGERVYPGTCRDGLHGKVARALRLRVDAPRRDRPHDDRIDWTDRRLGAQRQDVAHAVGDFVLRRADGCWAYQLAVVVDDAAQGITDVVRGEDLADNTPRQILLQGRLGLAGVRYLHTPLVPGPDGEKLSKQNGATPVDTCRPGPALAAAAGVLGLHVDGDAGSDTAAWLVRAVAAWRSRWVGA